MVFWASHNIYYVAFIDYKQIRHFTTSSIRLKDGILGAIQSGDSIQEGSKIVDLEVMKLGPKTRIYFSLDDLFNVSRFVGIIKNKIKPDTNYVALMKIRYGDFQYLTLGEQGRFHSEAYYSNHAIHELGFYINEMIKHFAIQYNFDWNDVRVIEVSFL